MSDSKRAGYVKNKQVVIERRALDLTFRTLLSCKCPISEKEEEKIFNLLSNMGESDWLDYAELLAVFEGSTDTVIHRLRDFSIWMAPTSAGKFVITREHVIRHLASSFHWQQVVASNMTHAYANVLSVPEWFMGHMLLPARITKIQNQVATAVYDYNGGSIRLSNLFAPQKYQPKIGEIWAVHFAALLDRLSPEECRLVKMLTELNLQLGEFRHDVQKIDYNHFGRHESYLGVCRERYNDYY
jgi:hypothetical protein